jgi:hypothetical protein
LSKAHQYEEALKLYEQVPWESHSWDVVCRADKARVYYQLKKFKEAIKAGTSFISSMKQHLHETKKAGVEWSIIPSVYQLVGR